MKTCTFSDFLAGLLEEGDECIYAVYDKKQCLYVGKTTGMIWDRWFSRMGGHIVFGKNNKPLGLSNIGRLIENHYPKSLKWIMKTFSVDDCKEDLTKMFPDHKHYSINDAENAMIRKLKPVINY